MFKDCAHGEDCRFEIRMGIWIGKLSFCYGGVDLLGIVCIYRWMVEEKVDVEKVVHSNPTFDTQLGF